MLGIFKNKKNIVGSLVCDYESTLDAITKVTVNATKGYTTHQEANDHIALLLMDLEKKKHKQIGV